MSDVTPMLEGMRRGDAGADDRLLGMVYGELRHMAAGRMAREGESHTLQPTALVHEAWMRLVTRGAAGWQNRAHFFASAAEAMRRILVDHARRKLAQKRSAGAPVELLDEDSVSLAEPPDEVLAVHEALERLAGSDPQTARLVKLRYFAGLSMDECAAALGVSKRSAEACWTYARVWLKRELSGDRG